MWKRTKMFRFCVIVSIADIVLSLTIDNQLQVIKNDCYERLAIGQRLDKEDVYRTTESKTVANCQKECTQDENKCRSLSFGIGLKGNATCELSSHVIKETVDLKPIGTVSDTDYDLYIKKLGCKLVIENTPDIFSSRPTNASGYASDHQESDYNKPIHHYSSDELHRVQSLVSISPGTNEYLRPSHYETAGYPGNNEGQIEAHQSGYLLHQPSNSVPGEGYESGITQSTVGHNRPGSVSHGSSRPVTPNKPPRREGSSYGSPDTPGRPFQFNLSHGPHVPSDPDGYHYTSNADSQHVHHTGNVINPDSEVAYYHNKKPGSSVASFKPDENDYNRPHNVMRPQFHSPSRPDSSNRPEYAYGEPDRPSLGITVQERPENDRPPFRPSNLNYPYDPVHGRPVSGYTGSSRPQPGRPNDPDNPNYGISNRPLSFYSEYDYGSYGSPSASSRPSYLAIAKPVHEHNDENPYGNRRLSYFYGSGQSGGLYKRPMGGDRNNIPSVYSPKYPHQKPIVSETIGPNGQIITSIITEINNVCFRRAMPGKRVIRTFVRRALSCERVEDCQHECAEEKRFVCEGFNYRLDPSGRGRGDCELLEIPYIRLDIFRDVMHDPDCDYYEKDRNSSPDCKGHRPRPVPYRPQGGGPYLPENDILPPYAGSRPPTGGNLPPYGGGRPVGGRPPNRYPPSGRPPLNEHLPPYGGGRPSYVDMYDRVGHYGDGHGYESHRDRPPRPNDDRFYDRNQPYNRRGDFDQSYHSQDTFEDRYSFHSNNYHQHNYDTHYPGISYLPDAPNFKPPHDYKSYEPYLPSYDYSYNPYYSDKDRYDDKYHRDRERDRNYWGLDKYDLGWGSYGGAYGDFGNRGNHYGHQKWNDDTYDSYSHGRTYNYPDLYPERLGGSKDVGKYGGSYGTRSYGYNADNYDYWGLSKPNSNTHNRYPSTYGTYNDIPPYKTKIGGGGSYFPVGSGGVVNDGGNLLVPPNTGYNYLNDECSLRSVAGFRFYKGIIKKIFSVPSVYECELLCFKEADFKCNSYAYRYTIGSSGGENCYLSDRNYTELDYFTDFVQDRDCDVYTMSNRNQCGQPVPLGRDDCFLLARSGHRLDQSCVKDTLNVKSIVECQIECLDSVRFICRSFSYRYGPPPLAGVIDNCQLADVLYQELDPRTDLLPEAGFVLYERRSFGHGCELVNFPIQGNIRPMDISKFNEICYVGSSSPAKLVPEVVRKSLRVQTEFECKAECTRCRKETVFHCMSLSYSSSASPGSPNCHLSDIYQRDLTENVDYVKEPDSWLFTWDHYNPKCYPLSDNGFIDHNTVGREEGYNITNFFSDNIYGIDTWKMYSVGGWPCKTGTCCRQDREIGFWFCELEGGSPSSWDYCCRPDHQCGYSKGYSYEWCYVGPSSTQWRKCNDRYYPYLRPVIDRDDRPLVKPYLPDVLHKKPYLPESYGHTQLYYPTPSQFEPHIPKPNVPFKPYLPDDSSHHSGPYPPTGHREPRPWATRPESPVFNDLQPPYKPNFRPDRPPASPSVLPAQPSLNEYETEFDNQFLDPPRPGGFGQPRHWPVSYLHKEMPPNVTTPIEQKFQQMKMQKSGGVQPKLEAIQNLIDIIKSNDLRSIQYQITNNSNKADDILYVQIPLPTNFPDREDKFSGQNLSRPFDVLPQVDLKVANVTKLDNNSARSNATSAQNTTEIFNIDSNVSPYRKGHITKTNVSNHGRARKPLRTEDSIGIF